ncbi:MAG TPA: hypothetical protein VFH27_03835, partial [Longimicrobiaceae bacterium]|nr:hypothetical protein [Longimicrobiaceae bacterium]
ELVAHAGHGALSLCVGDSADERLLRVAAEHLDTAVSGAEQLLLTLKVIGTSLSPELRAASPAFAKLVDKLPRGVEIDLQILGDVKRLLSVYRALAPADQDFLIPWMAVRAGANTLKAAVALVDGMRSDEVQAAVTEWRAHTAAAGAHREGSEREVEELVTKGLGASKVLAKVAAGLDLRKLSGTVVALDDTAFAEAHFASFCALNPGKVSTAPAKAAAARREAQRVDRVEGFRSEVDGRIYVRKGAISRHLVVHESLHRLGGNKLEELLGHGLMEGATETIARLISTELDIPLEQSGYAIERQALGLLLKAADIDSQELVAAYFTENVAAFTRKLVAAAGLEGLKELRSSPNAMVAVNAWTAVYSRLLTAQAEADKKKAAAIKADADSCIVS